MSAADTEAKTRQAIELYERLLRRMAGKATEIEVRRFVALFLAAIEEMEMMKP